MIGDHNWCIKALGEKFLSEAEEIKLPNFDFDSLDAEKQLNNVRAS